MEDIVEEPITDGNDLGFSRGRTTHYENGGKDRLDEFVNQYAASCCNWKGCSPSSVAASGYPFRT